MLDVAADSAGNVYVTGGDVGNVLPFRYSFVEMYDPSGVLQWNYGSYSSGGEWPGLGRGNSIALDECDNLYWSLWWSEHVPEAPFRADHAMLVKLDR
jgi:hypothetical protein